LGSVHLAQSIPAWLGCAVALMLAGSLLGYGLLGSYARKAHVSGVLAPQGGEVNIAASVAGRIAELRVKEGQAVSAGEVLMVLDTDKTSVVINGKDGVGDTAALVTKQLELRRLGLASERATRVTQAEVRNHAIQDRLATLDNELVKLADEIALQVRRRDLAARSVTRYEDLVASNFVSPVQVQTQQESLIDQDARLRSLERARLNLQRERGGLVSEQKQNTADLATVLATAERELLALNQEDTENTARRTTVVVAPRAGTVSAVAIGQGQWTTAGQTLAAIQPLDAPLEALLFAPSRTAGFVVPGQRVLLRYAAYPYQKFGLQSGRVVSVSQSAFAPSDLSPGLQTQFGHQSNETLYRVTVALDSQSIATYGDVRLLKAGMALDADIVQDRRRIIEWMLEPIFAAAKRA
jgi:membrane fusion protein